jgi:hypothetical protein
MLRMLTSLLLALLTACTTASLSSKSPWPGAHINTITKQLGPPSQLVNNPDGSSEYIYITNYQHFTPPPTPVVATSVSKEGRPVIITSQPNFRPDVTLMKCTISFQVNKQHIVTKVLTEGTGC